MASFDPGSSTDSKDVDVASGDYLVRAVWFDRTQNKARDGEYLRVKWEVVAGPLTGATFFANLSCKVATDGVAARWRSICKGLDITEKFEVGGAQGDKDFARLIKGRPFKARVAREEKGEWVNYDIQRTYPRATWSEGEVQAVKDLANEMGVGDSSAPVDNTPTLDDDQQIPF